MPLDPQIRAMLDEAAASNEPPPYTLSIPDVRQWHHDALTVEPSKLPPAHRVEDRQLPIPDGHIPVRIYWPSDEVNLPILYFVHGGGWVLGNLDSYNYLCHALTNAAGCITVAVGYRQPPEYKFPVPLWDVYTTAQWVMDHAAHLGGDPARIAIGGDSAGGNLSAAAALLARDRGGPQFVYQLLLYPVTDYYSPGTPSYATFADGFGLDREFMHWLWDHYISAVADINNPYLCPLRSTDLSGLPPTYILTAEYDVLHDEGHQYAKRLGEAGVDVTHVNYEGVNHGFLSVPQLDISKQSIKDIGNHLNSIFSKGEERNDNANAYR